MKTTERVFLSKTDNHGSCYRWHWVTGVTPFTGFGNIRSDSPGNIPESRKN